ncbi:624_t:CDS:2, partial [Acaulospora colombiana]
MQTILDTLDADIICLQETKITLDRLESSMAIIPGYDAYFSFSKGKAAYSGVVTYVKNDSVRPISAEEGISGILNDVSASDAFGCTPRELLNIDSEGRCVILEFRMFVLFNIYCPRDSGPERRPFITQFRKVLQDRVEAILRAGKEVIIMGDINVSHKEIDHCNPQQSIKDNGLESFDDHPSRKWFDGLVAPNGPLVDVCRRFHPGERGIYTCRLVFCNQCEVRCVFGFVNVYYDAQRIPLTPILLFSFLTRPSNYGTRLDYILASQGLMRWFKSCNAEQSIMGSDHCPVVGELHESISENGRTLTLKDLLFIGADGESTGTLRLCAKYLPKFSSNQKTLNSFFVRQNSNQMEKLDDSIVEKQTTKTITSRKPSDPVSQKATGKSVIPRIIKNGDRRTRQKVEIDKNQLSLASFFKQPLPNEISKSGTTCLREEDVTEVSGSSDHRLVSQSPNVEFKQNIEEIMDGCAETCVNSNNSRALSQWNAIFTPRSVPKCKIHGET